MSDDPFTPKHVPGSDVREIIATSHRAFEQFDGGTVARYIERGEVPGALMVGMGRTDFDKLEHMILAGQLVWIQRLEVAEAKARVMDAELQKLRATAKAIEDLGDLRCGDLERGRILRMLVRGAGFSAEGLAEARAAATDDDAIAEPAQQAQPPAGEDAPPKLVKDAPDAEPPITESNALVAIAHELRSIRRVLWTSTFDPHEETVTTNLRNQIVNALEGYDGDRSVSVANAIAGLVR